MIKGSSEIREKIKHFEGYVETPKQDNDGNYILGFGIQVDPKVKNKTNRQEAERDFEARVGQAESELKSVITRTLSQAQQDALVDMHYNMGLTKMNKHGIIDLVNQGKDAEVVSLFKRLNKAEDFKTGKMVAMGNLEERANYRAQLWSNALTGEPSPSAQLDNSGAEYDLISEIEQFSESGNNSGISDDDIISEVSRFSDQTPSVGAQFELATDISDENSLEMKKKVQRLSKEFNLPSDVAEGMLLNESEDTVRTKLSAEKIKAQSPGTAKWATNPDNNALLKKTKDYPQKVERATVKLARPKDNWQKAIDGNFLRLEDAATLGQMVFGAVGKSEGIARLRELDKHRMSNTITSPEVEAVKQSVQRLGTVFKQEWDKLANVPLDKDATDNIINILKAAVSAGQVSAEEVYAFAKTAATNKEAYALFMAESSGAPMAAGVIGTVAGTPLVGAAATYSTASLMAFGGKLREELEKFKDPTGNYDYEAFFSDPARIATLRLDAATYGLSIGAIETAFQFVGGKFFGKALPKNPVVATGAAAVGGAVSEGVGEAGARTAGQLVSGQEVTLKENVAEGVMESVTGGPVSAAGAVAQGTLQYINPRKGAIKTAETIDEANKANEDVNTLSELKETLKTDPASQDFPEQMADLMETSIDEAIQDVPEENDVIITPEPKKSEVEAEIKAMRQESKVGTISITPSEWEAFNTARGIDPFQALGVFSPRTQSAYSNNRETDTAIVIPVSEWALATEEDPDIDQIVRINGNTYNNLEANELIDGFEKDPLIFFDTLDDADSAEAVAETTIEEATPEMQTEVIEGDDSTPMRPLNLTSPFASLEEQEAYNSFRRRLTRAMPEKVQPELIDNIAELQLRRFKLRAAVSGLPIQEVFNRLQFGRKLSEGKARATMPTLEKDFFTVAFNKKDDANSVIHELAHVWLHEMAEDYQLLKDMDPATSHGDIIAYREAMEAARELLGLESLDEILAPQSEAKLTRIHETFAQTAEDYFMEGRSENSRIKRLMERMREWMAKHINALRRLVRKYPTLEVSPKVEFMFDAIFAGTKASEDVMHSMFPEQMFTAQELGAGAASYLSAFYDARSKAISDVYGKAFNKKGLNENIRIFETEYARISKEAEREVDSYPSMILRAQMFDAYQDFKKGSEKGPDPRISYESAKEYLSDGTEAGITELKKLVPFFMMTGKKKGGISVPDFMNLVGINSAEDLKNLLLEANRREELIQEVIDEKLQKEVAPLLKSDDEIHQIAEDAVNAEGREELIKREFKILMEMNPNKFVQAGAGLINTPESLNKEVQELYKAEAALQVGAAPSFKFSAETYLRDMNRQRREASKAFKARDFEKALARKVLEAKAYYAYKVARGAEKELAQSRKQVKNLTKVLRNNALFRNTYDYEIVTLAAETIKTVRSGAEVLPLDKATLPENSTLTDTNISVINEVLSKLAHEPGGKNLTVNGAINLGQVTKTLLKIARDKKSLELEGETLDLQNAVAEDLQKMGNGNVVEFKLHNEDKTSMLAAAKTSNTKLRAALDQMYKNTEEWATSNLGKISSWIGEAEAKSDIWKREKRTALREAMNKFPKGKTEKIIASDRFEWIPFVDKSDSPIFWDSTKFKFENMGELLVAMLYMGSESGAKKFLFGKKLASKADFNKVTQSFWDMVTDKYNKRIISKEHIEFVKKVWELMNEIHPQIKQVLHETEGFPMGKIEGWEVNTPIGKIPGGYFPVVHAKNISVEDFTALLDGGSNLIDWTRAFASKDTKMAIERTETYGDVNLNLNALNAYIEAASNVIHLRKPLIAFSKFIHEPSFLNTLETRRPGLYDNMIKPWMERVKLQSFVDPSSRINNLNPLFKYIRQNTGISFFIGNAASIFRQTLGSFQALPELGPRYISLAAVNMSLSPMTTFKNTIALSDVMKDRIFTSQSKFISIVEDLNRANDAINKGREMVEKVTYIPLQAAQAMTDILVWNAAYEKMTRKGKSQKEAISYADNVVKKTQGSSNISEMPNLQYGSEATKWFTQFSTVPLINYELATEPMRRGGKSIPEIGVAMSLAIAFAAVLPIAVDVLVLEGLFGDDEDEEDKEDKEALSEIIAKRGAGSVLESFAPTLGKYAGAAVSYGRISLSPSARKVEESADKGIEGLAGKIKYGTDLTPAQVKGVSELATILFWGVPVSLYGKLEVYNYDKLPENKKRILKMERKIQRRKAKAERGEF